MYTIYWTDTDGYYAKEEFASWWEMIGKVSQIGLRSIACSDNDLVSVYEFDYRNIKPIKKIYRRNVFVYDEYDRIIPYSEIRDACKEYKETIKKYKPYRRNPRIFEFRREPVPGIGVFCRSGDGCRHNYKNSWAKALFDDDWPGRRPENCLMDYWDDSIYRKHYRNWKKYRKTQYKTA